MKKLYVVIALLALMTLANASLAVGPGTDADTDPGKAGGGPGWQGGPEHNRFSLATVTLLNPYWALVV